MRVPPVFLSLIVLLFSSISIGVGAHGIYRDLQFRDHSARSMATIERLWITSSGGRHGGGTSYMAKYTFATPAGSQTVQVPISHDSYYYLHSGQQVPVLYLPDMPRESRVNDQVDADWHRHNHEGSLALGLFIAGIGCFILWTDWQKRRDLRLR